MKIIYLLIAVSVLIGSTELLSQEGTSKYSHSDVSLNYSTTVIHYSETIEDTFYIYVKLPKNYYDEQLKQYPAIFLLDGDISFPLAWSAVRYLQYEEAVPDLIIFGIGYGGLMHSNKTTKRSRDYTISFSDDAYNSGGGEKFLKYIKSELMTLIDSVYRIDKSNLTLSGHSLGGLFVLYTLFSESGLFKNYISSSPYLIDEFDTIYSLAESYSANNNLRNKSLFISYGSDEDELKYKVPINNIVSKIGSEEANNIRLKFRQFEEGSHFTTPAEAISYGLKFFFE